MTFEKWWIGNGHLGTYDARKLFEMAWSEAFKEGYRRGVAGYLEAVSFEREECAKLCDENEKYCRAESEGSTRENGKYIYAWKADTSKSLADAIRSRSKEAK